MFSLKNYVVLFFFFSSSLRLIGFVYFVNGIGFIGLVNERVAFIIVVILKCKIS